jgi:hypothetical protein
MALQPSFLPEARRLLTLAQTDKSAATAQLGALSLEEQAIMVCEAPLAVRAHLLYLTPSPEGVIPLLPEAELCFTVKAVGLADASWILEHATPRQIVAGIDLDTWRGVERDLQSMDQWLAAFAEAGEETLVRTAQSLDPEMIVLYLRDHVHVMLDPKDEEWQAPEGAQTLDGQFYFLATKEGDDLAPLMQLLHSLFRNDYWLYFRMLQGVVWELEPELEEWALRWRTGRLEDMGFPSWDEAMRIYGFIRAERRADVDRDNDALDISEWALPVSMSALPTSAESQHSVFRAVVDLDDRERHAFFYAFVGTANKIAVADRMPLGEPETLPAAIEKAAVVVSQGLDYVATENGLSAADTLRSVPLERLYRVGASLHPEHLPPRGEED